MSTPVGSPGTDDRRVGLGYALAAVAAILWGINGAVSKTILATGLPSDRLAQIRSLGAAVGILAIVIATGPSRLRLRRDELPYLAAYGFGGLAFVQWFYFLSLHRLAIGIALLIEYLGPLLIALWARFVFHEHVRGRVWVALALALIGLGLIVNLFGDGTSLSGAGVAFALAAAVAYSAHVLLAQRIVTQGRDAFSLLAYGFVLASIFWAVLAPWWSFPGGVLTRTVSLGGHLHSLHAPIWLLTAWMIVAGTIVPFVLFVHALRHIVATRAGIVSMLEPVVAALMGWAWLAESLGGTELVGAAVVLVAIAIAQTAR